MVLCKRDIWNCIFENQVDLLNFQTIEYPKKLLYKKIIQIWLTNCYEIKFELVSNSIFYIYITSDRKGGWSDLVSTCF